MKRFLLFFLAICFVLTAACAQPDAAEDPTAAPEDAGTAGEETGEPVSDTDTVLPEAPIGTDRPEEAASDTDAPADASPAPETDFTALTAEECVTDAAERPDVLPRIVLDCPGAQAINGAILAEFGQYADDAEYDMHYEVTKSGGNILSILIVNRTPMNDVVLYGAYNLDLATGLALSGEELLDQLGVDRDYLVQLETAMMGETFTYLYGQTRDMDPEFYDGLYARTTDPSNAETDRVWLGPDGQLEFIGRIYGVAGAEYYEYPLALGLYF